jgi:hypothetical protein
MAYEPTRGDRDRDPLDGPPRVPVRYDGRRQIEFPPMQTHTRSFETAMVVIAFVCVIVVLIILLATGLGTETRPTV